MSNKSPKPKSQNLRYWYRNRYNDPDNQCGTLLPSPYRLPGFRPSHWQLEGVEVLVYPRDGSFEFEAVSVDFYPANRLPKGW